MVFLHNFVRLSQLFVCIILCKKGELLLVHQDSATLGVNWLWSHLVALAGVWLVHDAIVVTAHLLDRCLAVLRMVDCWEPQWARSYIQGVLV